MPKIFIENQLNNGYEIEFCVGPKEYALPVGRTVEVEVEDGDCIYFDTVTMDTLKLATELLLSFGFDPVYSGFAHLQQAIAQAVEKPELLNNLSKDLYPAVAQLHDLSPANVERDIRFAIKKAAQTEAFQNKTREYFRSDTPPNKRFLALMYELAKISGC